MIKNFKEFLLEKINNILPEIVYHATPSVNLPSIKKNGLIPKLENHIAGSGEIHKDRIFLSIYNDPFNMNLPEQKINVDLKMLTISTKGLDINNFYPDDSLYWSFFNNDLSDSELKILFPKYYKEYKNSDEFEEEEFGDWLIDNDYDVTDEELDNLLKGKFYYTLPGSKFLKGHNVGEIAYKGIIPIDNIISISDIIF